MQSKKSIVQRSSVGMLVTGLGIGAVLGAAPPASASPVAGTEVAGVLATAEVKVAGSIRTVDGVPFSGASWSAEDADGNTQSGTTTPDGTFTAYAPLGQDLEVTLGNPYSGPINGTVTVRAGQTSLDIVAGDAHYTTITVVDAFDKPIRNATLAPSDLVRQTTWPVPGRPDLTLRGSMQSAYTNFSTDAMGQARIVTPGPLAEGDVATVTLRTSFSGSVTSSKTVRTTQLGGSEQDRQVTVAFSQAPFLEDARLKGDIPGASGSTDEPTTNPKVVLRDPEGTPIPGESVHMRQLAETSTPGEYTEVPGSPSYYGAQTDASGIATLPTYLPPGRYRVYSSIVSTRSVDLVVAAPKPTPATPTIFSVAALDGSARVQWSQPPTMNGPQVTGYTVTASPGGAKLEADGQWTTSGLVTGLVNGTAYTFTVTAHFADGSTTTSQPSTPVTPIATPKPTPTISSVAALDGSARVQWWQSPMMNGPQVTGYTVTASPGGAKLEADGQWTTSGLVTGLVNGTAYTFTVTAHFADGSTTTSQPSTPVTPAATPILTEEALRLPEDSGYRFRLTERKLVTVRLEEQGPSSEYPSEDDWVYLSEASDDYYGGSTIMHLAEDGTYRVVLEPGTYRVNGGYSDSEDHQWSVDLTATDAPADPAGDSLALARTLPLGTPIQDAISWGWSDEGDSHSDIDMYRVVLPHKGRLEVDLTQLPADFDLQLVSAKGDVLDTSTNDASNDEMLSKRLAAGTYYVKVWSGGAVGSGAYSDTPYTIVGHATPDAPGVPVASVNRTAAQLAWTAPDSDGGTPVTGYRIDQRIGDQAWHVAVADTGTTSTTATINGLATSEPSQFRVSAINAIGASEVSGTSARVTGVALEAPTAPSGVKAAPGNGQVALTWNVPASDGGTPITGYVITSGGQTWHSTGTSFTAKGLTNGTSYEFTVNAVNSVGQGNGATVASVPVAPPNPTTAPSAPTGVLATPGNGQVELTWNAPASDGGTPITGYVVTSGGHTWQSAGTSVTAQGLMNGTSYEFTVKAVNSVGQSNGATVAATPIAPPNPTTAPSSPTGIVVASVTSSTPTQATASLTWNAPTSDGGSAVTGYTVRVDQSGQTIAVSGTTATIAGLRPGTAYTFSVAAHNAVGVSAYSSPSAPVAPSAPHVGVTVTPVKRGGSLFVNVNPDMGPGYWKFKVQQQRRDGTWKTLRTTYKTSGSGETRTINKSRGTYRVAVAGKYGYIGATSNAVTLVK